jgi:hypothetical protein
VHFALREAHGFRELFAPILPRFTQLLVQALLQSSKCHFTDTNRGQGRVKPCFAESAFNANGGESGQAPLKKS